MANNHRARRVTKDDYDKPWKVKRLIGKYVKCSVCSGREFLRMAEMKLNAKRRRANKHFDMED